ncbi:MAG: iron-containing alcohol dehydrogenase [Christensenellales bacterium]|jgi:alcohol dehydrogenase
MATYFEFINTTKIISGLKALENIPFELEKRGAFKPMILSDKVLLEIGTVRKVINAFPKGAVELTSIYTDIPADSSVRIVSEIAKKFISDGCDSIIAVGGGSVIDTAKGVRLVLSQEVEDITDLMGVNALKKSRHIPLIAVPTTSGTGSEATQIAVIANPDKNIKMEFVAPELLPDLAVIDVRMTETMPAKVTASTAMDALCHAIEAYSCIQRNPVSSAMAFASVKLIMGNIKEGVENGTNKEARLALANGALLAGIAFSNSMVGNVHAIGHALGGVCKVPHGDAMSILLPHCMEYNLDAVRDLYAELLLPLGGADIYATTPKKDRAEASIQVIRDLLEYLNKKSGLPIKISETRAEKEDFGIVAKKAMNDGAMVVNPRPMSYEDVLELLNKAY